MGRTRNARKRMTKNKQYRKKHDTKRRERDIDQVQDDIKKVETTGQNMAFELDEDLPGMGQFYCLQCARHFVDEQTLREHEQTKVHKRRLKDVAQEQYSQREAELAAGKTIEVLPPAHPRTNVNNMDV